MRDRDWSNAHHVPWVKKINTAQLTSHKMQPIFPVLVIVTHSRKFFLNKKINLFSYTPNITLMFCFIYFHKLRLKYNKSRKKCKIVLSWGISVIWHTYSSSVNVFKNRLDEAWEDMGIYIAEKLSRSSTTTTSTSTSIFFGCWLSVLRCAF